MKPASSPLHVSLAFGPGPRADAEEVDQLTRSLRAEIRDLDVVSVDFIPGGPVPAGAKGVDASTVGMGALAIAILPVVVPKLIEYLQAWTLRGVGRTMKVKVQIGDRVIEGECGSDAASRREFSKLASSLAADLEHVP